jgi:hypothetical protein
LKQLLLNNFYYFERCTKLGSIGQYTGHRATTVKAAQAKFDKFNELIKLAGKDEDLIEILKKL